MFSRARGRAAVSALLPAEGPADHSLQGRSSALGAVLLWAGQSPRWRAVRAPGVSAVTSVLCWMDGPRAWTGRWGRPVTKTQLPLMCLGWDDQAAVRSLSLLCHHRFPSRKQAAVGNREEKERNRGERERADDA